MVVGAKKRVGEDGLARLIGVDGEPVSVPMVEAFDDEHPILLVAVEMPVGPDGLPYADEPLDHVHVPASLLGLIPGEAAAAIGVVPAFHRDLGPIVEAAHPRHEEQQGDGGLQGQLVFVAEVEVAGGVVGIKQVKAGA